MKTFTDLLSVRGISKSFGLNEVLKGIDLELKSAQVLVLIGGNGAGKSTLMKIIMGIYQPDKGEVYVCEDKIEHFNPSAALAKGIYMVPQEPLLFPNMSVGENILIGFKEKKSVLKERLINLMKELSWNIDLERKALSLSIAEQQLVELLRGMLRNARILILDEPTSALTFDEVNSLFKIIADLKAKGIGIIYITHRLAEVFEIGTHVAIMRDGMISQKGTIVEFSKEMLVEGLLPPNVAGKEKHDKEYVLPDYKNLKPVFRLENFSGYGFEDISLCIYPGEVLGIAGLVGAGRTELATTIFGKEKVLGGKAYLLDRDISGLPTDKIIEAGINYVPEDRKLNGLFSISSAAANTTSALLNSKRLGKFMLDKKEEAKITKKYIEEFHTKVTDISQETGSLSGGNQQKIVLGRILSTEPKLIILDEPTRGIDAVAREEVYSIIKELKKRGVAIMLISSDMEEVVELSDRAVVMFQGHKTGQLSREEISASSLMNASFDADKEVKV